MLETGDYLTKRDSDHGGIALMNLSKPLSSASRIMHALFLRALFHLPRQRSATFGDGFDALQSKIGPIFVINLDRQPSRWTDMVRELGRILDSQGVPLSNRVLRYSACDAQADSLETSRWHHSSAVLYPGRPAIRRTATRCGPRCI